MKKVLLALLMMAIASATAQAGGPETTDVVDVKIKVKAVLDDKVETRIFTGWVLDNDTILLFIKHQIWVGDAGFDLAAEPALLKVTATYEQLLVALEGGLGVGEDGRYIHINEALLFGKVKIYEDTMKATVKGTGLGHRGNGYTDGPAQYTIFARYNQKLSAMDLEELVVYLAKKLQVNPEDLADELGLF